MPYRPQLPHSDADRNLISNIHARGTIPEHAATRILNLAAQMMQLGASGYSLREGPAPLIGESESFESFRGGARDPALLGSCSVHNGHNFERDGRLKVVFCSGHVLLIGLGGHELKTVPPNNRLLVIGVGPKGMEHAVGASGDVGVVAKKTAAKSVAAVNLMGSYYFSNSIG